MKAEIVALALSVVSIATPPPALHPYVVIQTDAGPIAVTMKVDEAPGTVCNFLRYVQAGKYDGGSFFRTVVSETDANANPIDVIQAATPAGDDDPGFGPIPLERTKDTGLKHVAGAISMARDGPDTATSSFFIVVKDSPALDYGGRRNPDGQGFAVFGEVTGDSLEVLKAIHASPAKDERLTTPVRIRWIGLRAPLPDACRK